MSTTSDLAPGTREEALRALRTSDAEARRLVVRALGSAPSDAAVGVLRDVLGDEDWRVRKEAIQLAHALGDHRDVVPLLVEALRAPAEEVALRNAAVEALAGLGATAVEAVEAALHQNSDAPFDADGRKLAIEVLAAARQVRSLKVVVRATDDPDANVRAAAAEAIGIIGGEDAASALLSILDREERLLRLIALEGLNRLGAPVPLARLAPLLSDRILRHAAMAALARTGDPDAFEPLIDAASDPSRHVAETAMRAFASLHRVTQPGAGAARALAAIHERGRERLRSAALSGEVAVRRGAVAILAAVGDDAAIATLVDVLADDELAEDAEQALVALGARALPTLLTASQRGELGARTAAIRLLPRFARSDASLGALRIALADPTAEVVAAAASAFTLAIASGATPTEADVRELLRAAARREPKVAATALQSLRSLARRRPEVVRPHLVDMETGEGEAPIACALLAIVGGTEHVAWLSRAVSAESPRTRRAAVEALGQIGGAAAAR
ncbi:MAG: HEAT repeat domain-containing protein, partial [Polyangiales bacterium]